MSRSNVQFASFQLLSIDLLDKIIAFTAFKLCERIPPSPPDGSYVRQAMRRGLALEAEGITNPFTFGVIGSSDTHTAAAIFVFEGRDAAGKGGVITRIT